MSERRFIEEYFPINAIGLQSSLEKNLRQGYISNIHTWWSRKPLAVSRAICYTALIPFESKKLIPKENDFIIKLSDWESSLKSEIIQKARSRVLLANHNKSPKILDPFAGGGSIPLESSRLGCHVYSCDYNPVSIIIQKCTLEYGQKFSEIKLNSKNTLANNENYFLNDVKKWGKWIYDEARKTLEQFYPVEENYIPIAYFWSKTIPCQNPSCNAEIPLLPNYWLCNDKERKIALFPVKNNKKINFKIVGTGFDAFPTGFDPQKGNTSRAISECLICGYKIDAKTTRKLFQENKSSQKLIAVILNKKGGVGKKYRLSNSNDEKIFHNATLHLQNLKDKLSTEWGIESIPNESIIKTGGGQLAMKQYGMKTFGELFNQRQLLSLLIFCNLIRQVHKLILDDTKKSDYAKAITTFLGIGISRLADYGSMFCLLNFTGGRGVKGTFTKQAIPMIWSYCESNPLNPFGAGWLTACQKTEKWIENITLLDSNVSISQMDAASLNFPSDYFDAVLTDPPYYDSIYYSNLSDFFYVWLKRAVGFIHQDIFSTPNTPKTNEITQDSSRHKNSEDSKKFFEDSLSRAFKEIYRVLKPNGISVIVYAHKSTEGWETLINSLLNSGLVITAAWPVHTEMKARKNAQQTASLASSIYMVARKFKKEPLVFYREVKMELNNHLNKKLSQLWNEGISGADFFIAAIGSAIEVFGKYEKVVDDSDNQIPVIKLLDDTREIVTNYAIKQVLHSDFSDQISQMTRFYILWRWAYGEAKVQFDDALRMAQSVGIDIEHEWNRGFITKETENIRVLGPDERNVEQLQKSHELIDVLHLVLNLWKNKKKDDLDKLLKDKGLDKSDMFKRVGQAISESLPQESTEKKWLDGFLTGFRVDDTQSGMQTKLF